MKKSCIDCDFPLVQVPVWTLKTTEPFCNLFPIRETVLSEIIDDMNENGFDFITFVDLRGGFNSLKEGRVHILGPTQYELLHKDGIVEQTCVDGWPPCEMPEGQIWHVVLGRFVPESWVGKEMWVEQEAVFGEEDEYGI